MIDSAVQAQAAELEGQTVAFFFSGGKDAIAAGHLWRKYFHGTTYWCYLYFVDGLEIVETTLRYYERAWGIKIDRRPCYETKTILSRKTSPKKYTLGDDYREYKNEVGADWIVSGEKMSDGMIRRFRMQKLCDENMIDRKYNKVFPVGNWTNKQALAYCKLNKLPLPISYSAGMGRSLWIPDTRTMQWLRGAYPRDFQKIIDTFPGYGDAVFRADRGM